MRQLEGAWYSGEMLQLSKQRIDKLGYFTEVNIETPAVPGTTDQVDVNVAVVEKPTGALLLGAGFGSGEGLLLSGRYRRTTSSARASHVTAQVNTSKVNTAYVALVHRPVLDGRRREPAASTSTCEKLDANANNLLGNYRTDDGRRQLRLGVPVTEIDTISYGLGAEHTEIYDLRRQPADLYQDYVDDVRVGEHQRIRDGRLGARQPRQPDLSHQGQPAQGRRGGRHAAGDAGILQVAATSTSATSRSPRYVTFMLNGEIGYGDGYGEHARCRSSRTSTPAGSSRCAASRPTPSGRRTRTATRAAAASKLARQRRAAVPVPGHWRTTSRCG